MNRPSSRFAFTLGSLLAFSAMAWAGWKLGEREAPEKPIPPAAARSETRSREASRSARSEVAAEAKRKLEVIKRATTPEERLRATYELAMNLPTSEIEAWMDGRLFEVGGGYELTLFNKILKERWGKEDPGGLIAWLGKERSLLPGGMLADWAAREPQQVMDFLRERAEPGLAVRALNVLAGKDPALAAQGLREIAVKMVGEARESYELRELMKKLAATAPGALESLLAELPPAIRAKGEQVLIQKRLSDSFATEFPKLANHPDGWKIFEASLRENASLRDRLLENIGAVPANWRYTLATKASSIVSSQPEKWFHADLEAAGFSAEDAKVIRSRALMRIASRQPDEAMALLGSMELSPGEKAEMGARIVEYGQRVKAGEPEKRPEVANQPGDWLKQIAGLDPQNGNSYAYYSEIRKWDAGRIAELNKQFDTLAPDQKTAVANHLTKSGYGLDPSLTRKAIEHLVTVPVDPELKQQGRAADPVRLASNHAVQWLKNDPDAASAWVNRLPAGEAKNWAQKNVAAEWIQYDYEEANRWIKALPAGERKEVETFLKQERKY
jgi:hypothetical protein